MPSRAPCRKAAIGKGEDVDTAEITVRRILDELLDRAYRLRLRRLPQNSKEVFGFARKFHVTIRLITVAVTVCLTKTESKRQRPLRRGFSLPCRSSQSSIQRGKVVPNESREKTQKVNSDLRKVIGEIRPVEDRAAT